MEISGKYYLLLMGIATANAIRHLNYFASMQMYFYDVVGLVNEDSYLFLK